MIILRKLWAWLKRNRSVQDGNTHRLSPHPSVAQSVTPALNQIENPDRASFFNRTIADFGIDVDAYLPDVCACLLEFGFQNGSASLLVSASGEIQLLLSHGGGSLVPKDMHLAEALGFQLLANLNSKKFDFDRALDFQPPTYNKTHFFIRTKKTVQKLELGNTDKIRSDSKYYELYSLGQKIVTIIRESNT